MFTDTYGPPAFSLYTSAANVDHVIIRHRSDGGGVCDKLMLSVKDYLLKLNPKVNVTLPSAATPFEDFLYLTLAPTLYLDMSSFALAVAMINPHPVYSPLLWGHNHTQLTNVVWSEALVMTPRIGKLPLILLYVSP